MSWKIQNYLSSYYVCLEISEEMNDGENKMAYKKKKWEIDINFMRWMVWQEGGVSGKVPSLRHPH